MVNTGTRRSVLMVEDDPLYMELLEEAFTQAGFRTLRADNGKNALEVLKRENVDLVVSDFIMPEVNGLELCRLVSADLDLAGMKMVLYSCNSDGLFRKRAREMGAIDYLPKSEDTKALVEQICQLAGISPTELDAAELTRTVAEEAGQLRVLFDHLLDLVRIAALADSASEPARVAWQAALRSSDEIRRLLDALENPGAPVAAPPPAHESEPVASLASQ